MVANQALAPSQIRVGPGGEGQHWYVPGNPVKCAYEIKTANGKWRSAHKGDARKYGWFPGVSSILRQEAAPGLEKWKRRQVMLATETCMKQISKHLDISENSRFAAVEVLAGEIAKEAREKGTKIHAAIETFYSTFVVSSGYEEYINGVRDLLRQLSPNKTWKVEEAGTHPYGYGGRVDLYSDNVVVDIKGKDFGPEDHPKGWPDQGRQLAAYRMMLGMDDARCINVFVSRNNPGLVRAYEWDQTDLMKHWEEFKALLLFWQIKNGFERRVEI